MPGFSAAVNTDVDGLSTSASYGDIGDGTNGWYENAKIADGADVALGATDDAAVTDPAVSATLVALIKGLLTTNRNRGPYPENATAVIGGSGNVANATATATLTSASGKTMYLSGFTVTGAGATAASNVLITVAGLLGGSRTYVVSVPAGVTTGIVPLDVQYTVPLPASGLNTNITVSAAAFGAGNTHAAVVANGYYK